MNKKVITAYIHQLVNKYIIHLTLPIWIQLVNKYIIHLTLPIWIARCGVFEENKKSLRNVIVLVDDNNKLGAKNSIVIVAVITCLKGG